MIGRKHYQLAEDIMTLLRKEKDTVHDQGAEHASREYARAQVHATLALTAAVLSAGNRVGYGSDEG